jgi:hypothetical protein
MPRYKGPQLWAFVCPAPLSAKGVWTLCAHMRALECCGHTMFNQGAHLQVSCLWGSCYSCHVQRRTNLEAVMAMFCLGSFKEPDVS